MIINGITRPETKNDQIPSRNTRTRVGEKSNGLQDTIITQNYCPAADKESYGHLMYYRVLKTEAANFYHGTLKHKLANGVTVYGSLVLTQHCHRRREGSKSKLKLLYFEVDLRMARREQAELCREQREKEEATEQKHFEKFKPKRELHEQSDRKHSS